MEHAIRVRGLSKHFGASQPALKDVDLEIGCGEMVALIGASGSGKSTLLRHIAGLMASDADEGASIEVNGQRVQSGGRIDPRIRATRAQIGFVFQQFNLVGRMSVLVNVLCGRLHSMPRWRAWFRWFSMADRCAALDALRRVGILHCSTQRASTLSGGQQQRAAIARALVQGARVLLADEPIASLDPESARNVMEILQRIHREDGATVVVTLHQVDIALRYCPRVVALHEGRVVYDGPAAALDRGVLEQIYGTRVEELLQGRPKKNAVPDEGGAGHWPALHGPAAIGA